MCLSHEMGGSVVNLCNRIKINFLRYNRSYIRKDIFKMENKVDHVI